MFNIFDLQKKSEGLSFEEILDLKKDLQARNSAVLDLTEVSAKGTVRHEDGLYLLTYDLSYQISLASSRSMLPVHQSYSYPVAEVFVTEERLKELAGDSDTDYFLIIEDDCINLTESAADNILLNIPLKILSPEEEAGTAFPQGKDWQVMTEESYSREKADKKQQESPFAGLAGLLDQED